MEWLLTLVPIALVVLVCGGMHMVMMRGMHGSHHAGHDGQLPPTNSEDDASMGHPVRLVRSSQQADCGERDRVAELQEQIASLQREVDALRPRTSGRRSDLAAGVARDGRESAWRNDSRSRSTLGGFDDDGD